MSQGGKGRPPKKGAPAKRRIRAPVEAPEDRPAEESVGREGARPWVPEVAPAQIRDLDPPEQEALDALLREYGVDPREDWTRGRQLRVVGREDWQPRRRIVLVQPGVLALVDPFKPQTVGLPVAHLARKGARWTLEGACWVAPFAKKRVVQVKEKGETLFLYGRSVLARSVRKVVGPVQSGEEVFVVRAGDGRCIGIGIAQGPLLERGTAGDVVAVTNRMDLGHYLRDAQEVLE